MGILRSDSLTLISNGKIQVRYNESRISSDFQIAIYETKPPNPLTLTPKLPHSELIKKFKKKTNFST